MKDKSLIKVGSVCESKDGTIGIVTKIIRKTENGECIPVLWLGVTIIGKMWSSREPIFMYENVYEFTYYFYKEGYKDGSRYAGY